MAANNETGTIQPVSELGAICKKHDILFHTDAVQWFGKEPFENIQQFNADLVSVCGHKFHAPKGVGALYIKSPLLPDPILFGGGHENERRAGTENLSGIAGFVEAMERFVKNPVFSRVNIQPLTDRISILKEIEGVNLTSPISCKLANTISFTVSGTDSMTLLAALDMEGICASSGSACSAGSLNPSHVISAMGRSDIEANSLIRFSLGRETLEEDVDFVLDTFPKIIERIRSS
jgi:cysteine desulfurase